MRLLGIKQKWPMNPKSRFTGHHLLFSWRPLWQEDTVDDVDYTVTGFDVCRDDVGIVNHHFAICYLYCHILAEHSLRRLQLDHIGSHDLAGNNVVREYRGQLIFVLRLEQILNSPFRKLSNRVVRWSEHREWPLTLQCFNKSGGLDRCEPVS
jgi:hypothetical protein